MQKTTELIMTKMLNKQKEVSETTTNTTITASSGQAAISQMTATIAKTGGDVAAGQASGAAKTIAELGWWGIPLIAVISAALSALMGLAMSKMSKAKEEVAAATGASYSQSRVAAGMLTYAEGDYPVLGNDGQIYNARYQKELKTGVYGGGAHFGIFSEKKPEMIVDGNTTEKLVLNYPHIYDAILTIARNGQLRNAAIPAFAARNYPAAKTAASDGETISIPGIDLDSLAGTLNAVASAVGALNNRLDKPISAYMNPYGDNGAVKQMDKASKFMKRRGLN